jgi:RNA-directed DNA polymerase
MTKTQPTSTLAPRNKNKNYNLDQCVFYKLGSKRRLGEILFCDPALLEKLSQINDNYKKFTLPLKVCEFTGKIKKQRQVQEPKHKLRSIHQRILKLLTGVIAPNYAHAAVQGRSYRTNASFHQDAVQLATFDIRKFYPSTSKELVYQFWAESLKCAPDVAKLLSKLTCFNTGLPTGSPLSPLLSLLANQKMLNELKLLADLHRLNFTCYIDDLTFSGEKIPKCLMPSVARIMLRYGHSLSREKTRIYRRSDVEMHVTGTVIRNGKIEAPSNRFHKARKITKLMADSGISSLGRLMLAEKLVGVLGEAAFLDDRHLVQADHSRRGLSRLRQLAMQEAKLPPGDSNTAGLKIESQVKPFS